MMFYIWLSLCFVHARRRVAQQGHALGMGWLQLIGSAKLWVSFAKKPYKRDYILQKRPIILMSLLIVAIPYSALHITSYLYVYIYLHTYLCILYSALCIAWYHVHTYVYTHTYQKKSYTYHFILCQQYHAFWISVFIYCQQCYAMCIQLCVLRCICTHLLLYTFIADNATYISIYIYCQECHAMCIQLCIWHYIICTAAFIHV